MCSHIWCRPGPSEGIAAIWSHKVVVGGSVAETGHQAGDVGPWTGEALRRGGAAHWVWGHESSLCILG